MKLTFRKHDVKDLSQLQALVAENAEAVEPGFRVIATGVNFGRSTVEVVGVDRSGTPALVALGFAGDDAMLFRMVEAYAWTLEYPESVRRLVPDGGGIDGWPPRVMFVAERLPESFLRKIRLLAFHAVNCFEYRCVEVNDATGFYLDPVDWARSAPPADAPPTIPAAEPGHTTADVGRQAPTVATRAASEPAPPPAAGNALPSRWFGLRPPPRETPTPERSPGRTESPAPPAASTIPIAAAASEPAPPPAAGNALPSRWFGLLPPPRETPTPERSPGRTESPAPLAASIIPIAEDPAVEPPRPVASEPPAPTDAAEIADDREIAPAWRKFLEKLAGTLDLRPADHVPAAIPAAAPAEKTVKTPAPPTEPVVSHAGPSRNGWANRHEDPRQRALLDVVTLPPNGELAPQWRKFLEKTPFGDAKIGKFAEKAPPAEVKLEKFPERAPLGEAKIEKFPERVPLDEVKLEKFPERAPLGETKLEKFPERASFDEVKLEKFPQRAPLDEVRLENFPERAPLAEAKIETLPEKAPFGAARTGKLLGAPGLDAKVAAVREYLHHEFPMCTIYDFHEHQRNAHVLQLEDSQGKVSHLATITVEFLETHGEAEFRTALEKMQLSQAMRQAGQAGVLVTPSGPEIQRR
jgi:hypothetical protein